MGSSILTESEYDSRSRYSPPLSEVLKRGSGWNMQAMGSGRAQPKQDEMSENPDQQLGR